MYPDPVELSEEIEPPGYPEEPDPMAVDHWASGGERPFSAYGDRVEMPERPMIQVPLARSRQYDDRAQERAAAIFQAAALDDRTETMPRVQG
jgi:hypothetical protein